MSENTIGLWAELPEQERFEKHLEELCNSYSTEAIVEKNFHEGNDPIEDLSNIKKELNNSIAIEMIKYMKEKYGYNNEAEIRKQIDIYSDKYFASFIKDGIRLIISKTIDAIKTSEIKGWVEKFKEWMKKWGSK